ncbi:MFS transporter [Nonomuraea jiangxiensis]|uniref:Predicted arabinose efflux permease, MFS family n=1 Tax=Nonomuraea jiangxiensis TaxID=633440 RepID=A0A1G9P6E7_9ACTN|nr:MFS transporter [Nonomuraea jiangxiensis]SDL94309.1 Predicted arabinose efflux permease, MFS family [Nonomuraea jiangxiensis]
MTGETRQETYAALFKVAEFRALWSTVALSRGGTQLARVALAILAFQRTGSPVVTSLVYALTLLPAIVGGSFLGGLADRYPRREVLVACALSRAGLIALIAIPGIPLPVLCALLFVVQLLDSPAKAAQMALLPDLLPDRLYALGVAAVTLTSQIVTLLAFAVGGALVGTLGPNNTLLLTAASFVLMGLITKWRLRRRPAARDDGRGTRNRGTGGGVRLILASPPLRNLLALALLAGFYVVPDVLATPYAAELGLGTTEIGLLMAAMPVGNLAGVYLFTRFVPPARRLRWMAPMAVASSLPLVFSELIPGFLPSLATWALVGLLSAYQVTANTEFVRLVPHDRRGQALGVASSLLVTAQGAGMLLSGLLADHVGVLRTLVLAGVVGCLVGLFPALGWRRARSRSMNVTV